jgi:hypothetical protein
MASASMPAISGVRDAMRALARLHECLTHMHAASWVLSTLSMQDGSMLGVSTPSAEGKTP